MIRACTTMLVAAMLAAVPANAAPRVGSAAPAFSASDASGKPVSLQDFRGKTVILEWTNPECPYVVKHYGSGNMQALQREAATAGAVWLTINSGAAGQQGAVDGPTALRLASESKAASSAILLDADGKIGRAYDARTTPHMFIIDAKGELAYMGGIDDKPTTDAGDIAGATNHVRAALADLVAGRSVAKPVTQPYGCSVKYGS